MFIFLLVELLLDYVLVIEFRQVGWMVISYVMLFFAATGGMLGVAAKAGRTWTISGVILFLYMLVELLLDYVFKVEFRQKWITHAPYIILEYIALFGLIGISFSIDRTWGFLVSISFWFLLASLIYLYWGRKKEMSQWNE